MAGSSVSRPGGPPLHGATLTLTLTLTDTGYGVVVAAPAHVRSVRRYVLEPLIPADRRALMRIATKLKVRPIDLAEETTTGPR